MGAEFSPGDLEPLRASIDRVDQAVADLLVRRVALAQRVALVKHLTRQPARDEGREEAVRAAYQRRLVPHGWPASALDAWMDALIDVSVTAQRNVPVAYQGGEGSWSHASLRRVVAIAAPRGHATFEDAWKAALQRHVAAAWLPVANSTLGPFREVHALLEEAVTLHEAEVPVSHALMAPAGSTLEGLRRVMGHEKALAQCRATLERIAGSAELVAVEDGAAWAAGSGIRPGDAVVGCPVLAALRDLRILSADVSDRAENATTFRLVVPRAAL